MASLELACRVLRHGGDSLATGEKVVAIDFAHESVRVVVADVAHAVLAEEERYLGADDDASEALHLGAVMVTDALEVAGLDHSRVLGVGVGVPGPVDQARGCPHRELPGPRSKSKHNEPNKEPLR